MAQFPEVLEFIASASSQELERITAAAHERSRSLARVRAMSVSGGDTVRIINLSPKALNGCRGEVVSICGQRADVRLDAADTERMKRSNLGRRMYIPPTDVQYTVMGVPLQCLEVQGA